MRKGSVKNAILITSVVLLAIAVVVLSILLSVKKKADDRATLNEYYSMKTYSFGIQYANLSKGQIVFIGDSITDLYPLDDYYADLDKAVYNRGISGDTTQGVLDRLKISLYDVAPQIVVLMIGVNDINGGKTNEYIADNYGKILSDIKTNLPSSEVFCVSVLPMNTTVGLSAEDVKARNEQISSLNERITALAVDRGYAFVDLNAAVRNGDGTLIVNYSDDGLHLNANGFAVWTATIKPLLR